MVDELPLICNVTSVGAEFVATCVNCGWVSSPTASGVECGALWDEHRTREHRAADAGADVTV